jgi:plasmid stabilization system protein ParE
MRRLRFDRGAVSDLLAAHDWYAERSSQAAAAFLTQIERSFALIAEAPRRWPRNETGERRFVLHGFSYAIYFRESTNEVFVLAIAHAKRRPGYWRDRL